MMEKFRLFLGYAREDTAFLERLHQHLEPLQKAGLIDVWHDGDVSAGALWEEEIKRHVSEAHLVLLLISAHFIASTYCYDVEMPTRCATSDEPVESRGK